MKIWVYGKVMSGKTTFASQFEDAYIISTDGNAEYLELEIIKNLMTLQQN